MPSEAKQQTRLQILVVDDEQEATSFCQQVLARSGYAVSTSGNPQQALQLLATMDIDLLVTDLRMPGMSGLELIETARQQRPDLVSIVIMGHADAIETAMRALREAHLICEHDRLLTLMPLLDLSRSCIKARDIDALLAEGLAITCAALHGSAACFYRWHSDREQLELLHRYGCDNLPLPDTGALASQLRSASEAIVLSTQQTEEGAPSQNVPQAIAPALATDGLIGALLIVRPQAATPFGRSDLETLTIMANQIATLYDNARLVQELESWDRRLERRVHEATEELIQAQERMIRTERLAAIGQLGASIAYELRNPLGVISNSVYYLQSRIAPDDPKAHRHLAIIQNEIATVNDITNDLMSFARVGQIEIRPEDPTALARAALARVPIPPSVSVHVQSLTNGARVWADADRLRQVLINLITNAVQAMPDGGRLSLTTRAENDHVVFEVADTGVGIPEDQSERIFEPLFTTKARGMGIGLAIARMLVEAHQGTIQVDSTPGQGSRFTVRLPQATQDGQT